ncbi:hypothetical protein I6I45_26795 [Pseudomonas fluorescens]|uniref:hypothetical protein n=1 Tax=Pseudomonas sp. NBRC 111138 TaxID=1661053 RepID=UPI0006D41709|nr:hypothetical protein [Pseudomonas sp. NBRC 111138]QQU68207.1 hypothetical protein I6I45_26795 [Pseudomonas fluorescens]
MASRQTKAKAQPKAGKSRASRSSSAKTAELQAVASLEEARHNRLCQLLEHTLHRHCDDYLRQLATTAVHVKTVAEIATMQAQLLQWQNIQPKNHEVKKPAESISGLPPQLGRLLKQLYGN